MNDFEEDTLWGIRTLNKIADSETVKLSEVLSSKKIHIDEATFSERRTGAFRPRPPRFDTVDLAEMPILSSKSDFAFDLGLTRETGVDITKSLQSYYNARQRVIEMAQSLYPNDSTIRINYSTAPSILPNVKVLETPGTYSMRFIVTLLDKELEP